MALLTPADFRPASLHEACIGLDLTDEQADDATLTASIARLTTRISRWCSDTFETATGTVEVDGAGSYRLMLPQRFTAVSAVKIRDAYGTLGTAATVTAYRLHSSLNAAGTERVGGTAMLDWLEVVSGGVGLPVSYPYSDLYRWPYGSQTVQVTGTYGWTVAPPEIKRALALVVWDHVTRQRGDLRSAESMQAGGTLVRFTQPDPSLGIYSGIAEADEIIRDYSRKMTTAVA